MIDAPSGGAPEKAPMWDLSGTEGCGGGIRFSWCSWMFGGTWIYIEGRSMSVEQQVKEICPRGNKKVIIYFLIS